MARPFGIRPRAALAAAAIALLAFAGFSSGCGAKFELPTESKGGTIPADGSYQMEATWIGMDGVRDVLLTRAGQLFVLFNHGGDGTAPRGAVRAYARFTTSGVPVPLAGYPFRTLFSPAAMCENGVSIFVLDQGDTCIARTNPATQSCHPDTLWNNDVVDLAHYWRVREYNMVGAGGGGLDTVSTFTDTSFAQVEGVAADSRGFVYVSGTVIVNVPDPFDDHIRTRSFLRRIYRYARGPRYPGVVPGDPNMPGAAWHRDSTWRVEEGAGGGFVGDPRGIQWQFAKGVGGIFVSDAGKNEAQKLYDDLSSTPFFRVNADGDGVEMSGPVDVAADENGAMYVADTGNQRVLRYLSDGTFAQRVDVERDAQDQRLQQPVAVAADSSLVFVGDRGLGKVIRYRRRQ